MDFKVDRLHPEIAARAKQILQKWRVDDVKAKSAGAGTFYIWVSERMCIETTLCLLPRSSIGFSM